MTALPGGRPLRWCTLRAFAAKVRGWVVMETWRPRRRRRRWPRWLAVGVVGSGALYLGVVGGIFVFVRYERGIAGARFLDLACPWRRPAYTVARGNHYIAQGQALLARNSFGEAHRLVRLGVAASPAHRGGRLLLAAMTAHLRRPDAVRRILLDGLPYHADDPVFVRAMLSALLQQQDDGLVINLARGYLGRPQATPLAAHWYALAAATASEARGQLDGADEFLHRAPKLARSREGRLLAARIEFERGQVELAVMQIRQLASEWPHDLEIHQETCRQLRASSQAAEARRCALLFALAHPASVPARVQLLHAYTEAGETAAVAREANAFLRDFAHELPALLSLAAFAAESGNQALVRQVASVPAARSLAAAALRYLEAEAALVARDFHGALNLIRDVDPGRADSGSGSLWYSVQAVAHLGLGENAAGRMLLGNYLQQSDLRVENLLAVARRLLAMGAEEEARRVLARAVEIEPLHRAALPELIQVELATNRLADLPGHVEALLKLRRPSHDILRVVQQKLGSDLLLFSPGAPAALRAVEIALAESDAAARRMTAP
jgi:tetratricopeptide (TPR) repeat protein